MNVDREECDSGVQHLLPRSKSDLEEMMGGDSIYSPTRKTARSEAVVPRVHCIPVVMLFVFFVLWVSSSEVNELHLPATVKPLLKSSEVHLKVIDNNDSVALPDTRTMLFHEDEDESSSHHDVNSSFGDEEELGQSRYIRGNARRTNAR